MEIMYSILEIVEIVDFYKATVVAIRRKFCQHYNVCRSSSSNIIKCAVVKFITKGSFLNQQQEVPGRPKKCHTVENIETVRLSVIKDPRKSYRNVFRH